MRTAACNDAINPKQAKGEKKPATRVGLKSGRVRIKIQRLPRYALRGSCCALYSHK
jgi:hypothetical protein